jgi:hypothetical protein
MMGPDYTHWHGTYEVAKHFYSHYIPELDELAGHHLDSGDPAKKDAAAKLKSLLGTTLNHENHVWYLNQMSPEEKARRDRERIEFQQRYAK